MLNSDQLDRLAQRTVRELGRLAPHQRRDLIDRILRADPELAPCLPELLSMIWRARGLRKLGPLMRDSVS